MCIGKKLCIVSSALFWVYFLLSQMLLVLKLQHVNSFIMHAVNNKLLMYLHEYAYVCQFVRVCSNLQIFSLENSEGVSCNF